MNEIKTSWCKQTPPYGAFDDYVIIESIGANQRILIRPEEFDFLTNQLHDNWKSGKSKHIQLLREWNECKGFNDIEGNPSILLDKKDTIDAIKQIRGVDNLEFAKMTEEDLNLILAFLIRNQDEKLKIWKE